MSGSICLVVAHVHRWFTGTCSCAFSQQPDQHLCMAIPDATTARICRHRQVLKSPRPWDVRLAAPYIRGIVCGPKSTKPRSSSW